MSIVYKRNLSNANVKKGIRSDEYLNVMARKTTKTMVFKISVDKRDTVKDFTDIVGNPQVLPKGWRIMNSRAHIIETFSPLNDSTVSDEQSKFNIEVAALSRIANLDAEWDISAQDHGDDFIGREFDLDDNLISEGNLLEFGVPLPDTDENGLEGTGFTYDKEGSGTNTAPALLPRALDKDHFVVYRVVKRDLNRAFTQGSMILYIDLAKFE